MLIVSLILPISAFIIVKIGQSIKRKARRASLSVANVTNIINERQIFQTSSKITKGF